MVGARTAIGSDFAFFASGGTDRSVCATPPRLKHWPVSNRPFSSTSGRTGWADVAQTLLSVPCHDPPRFGSQSVGIGGRFAICGERIPESDRRRSPGPRSARLQAQVRTLFWWSTGSRLRSSSADPLILAREGGTRKEDGRTLEGAVVETSEIGSQKAFFLAFFRRDDNAVGHL